MALPSASESAAMVRNPAAMREWMAAVKAAIAAVVPGGGFPISYNDGTYTYTITATGGILTVLASLNATPTTKVQFLFDIAGGGDFDLTTKNDVNITATHDLNAQGNHGTNIGKSTSATTIVGSSLALRGITVNPTGGSAGDVLTFDGASTIALASPTAGVQSQDYRQVFLLGGM